MAVGNHEQSKEVKKMSEAHASNEGYMLNMQGICKSFAGVHALKNVHFNLKPGEVNVLLGENGAGKSTLIKIITGAYTADTGNVELYGKLYHCKSAIDAQHMGISAVYQEFNLMPKMKVYENIFITNKITKSNPLRTLDRREMIERSEKLLAMLGANFGATETVADLGVAQKQMVEIAKALSLNARLIIFDEPTAVLTSPEIRQLMDIIRKLKAQGIGVVYISHRLEEIYEIGDRVTILRDGQNVCVLDLHERKYDVDEIIAYMVGRTLEEKFPKQHFTRGKEILRVEHLSSPGHFEDVSFTLYEGELLSMAGLVGAGRTEVAKTIFGALPRSSGRVFLCGQEIQVHEPRDAIRHGISLLSEDRKDEGLVQKLSIETNMMMVDYKKFQKNGIFRRELMQKHCLAMAERLKLNTRNMQMKVSGLSGGNQQKVSLGKWLFGECRVIILDEPTRGVDVGAKVEIYNAINDLIRQGIGVIMISSEMPEILGMSDRIIVMCEGKKTGELLRGEATQETILKYATGQEA